VVATLNDCAKICASLIHERELWQKYLFCGENAIIVVNNLPLVPFFVILLPKQVVLWIVKYQNF
jgi:hypothetical protein